MFIIYIGSQSGCFYTYDLDKHRIISNIRVGFGKTNMGCTRLGNLVWLAEKEMISKFVEVANGELQHLKSVCECGYNPQYHQMTVHDDVLYITCTRDNELHLYDVDSMDMKDQIKIRPPKKGQVHYEDNYNHINYVFIEDGKIYVTCSKKKGKFGPGAVVVLDVNTGEELDRFEVGWEIHHYCLIDGQEYNLCGSSPQARNVREHPHKAGLMVDREFVWETDPEKNFPKGLAVDDDHIYITSGTSCSRDVRARRDGWFFVLDREFNQVYERCFEGTGGFTSVLLPNVDYADSGFIAP